MYNKSYLKCVVIKTFFWVDEQITNNLFIFIYLFIYLFKNWTQYKQYKIEDTIKAVEF